MRDKSTCSICNKRSINKTARLKHEAIIHKNEAQKFKCDKCPKSYTSMGTLQYHKMTRHGHGKEVKESCDLCGKQLSSVGALTTHKKFVHSTEAEPVEDVIVMSVVKQSLHYPTLKDTCVNSMVSGIID